MTSVLKTAKGPVPLPAFFPVTTFGAKFPLDEVVRPHLARFAHAIMVSRFYADKLHPQHLPVFIDSGGFASLFKGSKPLHFSNGTHGIQTRDGSIITPESVLTFQEQYAEIAATLDFIVSPGTAVEEGRSLQDWTIANAMWALAHRKRDDLKLFASLQAWNADSMRGILDRLLPLPFDGFALGGMVPRVRKPKVIFELIAVFREMEPQRPLHVFGVGSPSLVKALFKHGVSSVDSSNFVRQAASKRYLLPDSGQYVTITGDLNPAYVCSCGVCSQFSRDYLALEGELNNMALALHNLAATFNYLEIGADYGTKPQHLHSAE